MDADVIWNIKEISHTRSNSVILVKDMCWLLWDESLLHSWNEFSNKFMPLVWMSLSQHISCKRRPNNDIRRNSSNCITSPKRPKKCISRGKYRQHGNPLFLCSVYECFQAIQRWACILILFPLGFFEHLAMFCWLRITFSVEIFAS